MSNSSNKSLLAQTAIGGPAFLALVGLIYDPARALVGLGILAALLALFKSMVDAAIRTIAATFVTQGINQTANQRAQSNPTLAVQRRLRTCTRQRKLIENKNPVPHTVKAQSSPRSKTSLNSEANRIAQTQPQRAIELRLLAAYA